MATSFAVMLPLVFRPRVMPTTTGLGNDFLLNLWEAAMVVMAVMAVMMAMVAPVAMITGE